MMNLEVRPVRFEDTARQVIGHGVRRKPQEYLEKISTFRIADNGFTYFVTSDGRPMTIAETLANGVCI